MELKDRQGDPEGVHALPNEVVNRRGRRPRIILAELTRDVCISKFGARFVDLRTYAQLKMTGFKRTPPTPK
jgi:hypothetical protein